MTGLSGAALALSAALMISAPAPRRRLGRSPNSAAKSRRPWPVLAGCLAGCVATALIAALPPMAAAALAVLGVTVGVRYRRRVRRRRRHDEESALTGALDVLVGELRIGAHPAPAFEVAAAEAGDSHVAAGLSAVAGRARLGADVAAGLRCVAGTSSLPAQWERLAVYWQLGYDRGLAISTLMSAAQRDIVERQRFSARVDADLAGARASATILAALPALGVLMGEVIGARPVGFLLGRSGSALLLAGAILLGVGLLWSDRITAVRGRR